MSLLNRIFAEVALPEAGQVSNHEAATLEYGLEARIGVGARRREHVPLQRANLTAPGKSNDQTDQQREHALASTVHVRNLRHQNIVLHAKRQENLSATDPRNQRTAAEEVRFKLRTECLKQLISPIPLNEQLRICASNINETRVTRAPPPFSPTPTFPPYPFPLPFPLCP